MMAIISLYIQARYGSPLRGGDRILSINNQVTSCMNDDAIKGALLEPTLLLVIERYGVILTYIATYEYIYRQIAKLILFVEIKVNNQCARKHYLLPYLL